MEAGSSSGSAMEQQPQTQHQQGSSSGAGAATGSTSSSAAVPTASGSGSSSSHPPSGGTGGASSAPKKKKEGAGGPPKSKAYANPLASRADELKYRTKYKHLRGKVKEIEEENAKMQAQILKTKRQIQRLRLERSILYDRFQESKQTSSMSSSNIPVTSLQAQLSSAPFGSLNGSTSSMHGNMSPHERMVHSQPSHVSSSYQPSMSQGYHPSQFTTHPGLMHDSNDSLMIHALQRDMQSVDSSISMAL